MSEMITAEENGRAIETTNKVHGVIEYIEKQFQKYFFALCLCCTNFSSIPACLVALQGFKITSQPGCGIFSKRNYQKGLMTSGASGRFCSIQFITGFNFTQSSLVWYSILIPFQILVVEYPLASHIKFCLFDIIFLFHFLSQILSVQGHLTLCILFSVQLKIAGNISM
jgi:hypothetical protein